MYFQFLMNNLIRPVKVPHIPCEGRVDCEGATFIRVCRHLVDEHGFGVCDTQLFRAFHGSYKGYKG